MRNAESGFTLLELLATVSIVGVLAATAVPRYHQVKAKSFDVAAKVALREIAIAQDARYIESHSYVNCNQDDCHTYFPQINPVANGVSLEFVTAGNSFTGTASHTKGTGKVYHW